MGLSFAEPISADFSIREFALRGQENAHGWGLAWYPDRSVAIVKEPIQWRASKYSHFLETYQGLHSRIYIAHVRHRTTGGGPTHADTHPFVRELAGREYCFAHNGTLDNFAELPLGHYKPVGGTDSEHLFCHLLHELGGRDSHLESEANWRWLHAKLASLNARGRLNCLLADGQRLLCYRDAAGWKGMTIRRVHISDQQVRSFEDPTLKVELEGESVNRGHVVATHPLSSAGWHSVQPGELMVLECGVIRFSSHRSSRTESIA